MHLGAYKLRVAVDELQRVLLDCLTHRLNKVVARSRQSASDDNDFGIEDIDEVGELHAELHAYVLEKVDAQVVLGIDGVDYVVERDIVEILELLGKRRHLALADTVDYATVERAARNLGFQTAFLAAVAHYLIVERVDVSEFAGEARFALVHFAVEDNTESETPAEIDEKYVFLAVDRSAEHLAVSHCAGVVLDANRHAELFRKNLAQRRFLEYEKAIAVARRRIDATTDVDAGVENLALLYTARGNEIKGNTTYLVDNLFLRHVEVVGYVEILTHYLAVEVAQADIHDIALHVDTEKISRLRIETVGTRLATRLAVALAIVVQDTLFYHFVDKFRHRRYTQIKLLGEFGDC